MRLILQRGKNGKVAASKEVATKRKGKRKFAMKIIAGGNVRCSSVASFYEVFAIEPPYQMQESVIRDACVAIKTSEVLELEKRMVDAATRYEEAVLKRAGKYVSEKGGALKIFEAKGLKLKYREGMDATTADTSMTYNIMGKMRGY